MSKIINVKERQSTDIPLVSVVCTAFNQRKYIKDTLEGFLIQETAFPVEFIVHDDASTDGTYELIREYELKNPHLFKPIYQKENQHSKKTDVAKHFLYPRIRGKYVAICEGDDFWIDPLKLQKQVDFLEKNEDYGLVYTDINRVNKDGAIIDRDFFKSDLEPFCESFENYLLYAPFRAPCTWLFRKSVYKERSEKYAVGDLPMLLDIVAHHKIHKLNDTTAHYRVLPNSASHSTNIDAYYKFSKSGYQVQLDYAKKYEVSNDLIDAIKERFAIEFYNFSIATGDLDQIKDTNKLLMHKKSLSLKFRIAILLSRYKFGRKIVRNRLIKRLGFTHK